MGIYVVYKLLTQYEVSIRRGPNLFVRVLTFFVYMVYTLRKRYAHAEHASGMLDVRYS